MKIKFRFISGLDKKCISYKVNKPLTVLNLIEQLSFKYKDFNNILPRKITEEKVRNRFLILVNGKVSTLDNLLNDNDLVEFIPPIIGG